MNAYTYTTKVVNTKAFVYRTDGEKTERTEKPRPAVHKHWTNGQVIRIAVDVDPAAIPETEWTAVN